MSSYRIPCARVNGDASGFANDIHSLISDWMIICEDEVKLSKCVSPTIFFIRDIPPMVP